MSCLKVNSQHLGRSGRAFGNKGGSATEPVGITSTATRSECTILPVPDYSFNLAAPDDVSGWPQYADWQQKAWGASLLITVSVLLLTVIARFALAENRR